MKRILTILLIMIVFAGLSYATTWKGGNTANIDGDTACYSQYLVHTDAGCETTLVSLPCVPVVLAGDTLCLPVINLDSLSGTTYVASETLYIDTAWNKTETLVYIDTIYNYDTLVYIQQGGAFFNIMNKYVCDSTIAVIDTTTSPYDTSWCKFCDSVLVVNWFRRDTMSGGVERFAYWELLTDNFNDTCDIYSPGSRYIEYTFCYDCDTNIYIDTAIFLDSTVLADSGVWVVDSLTGGGIWWKYCNDTDVYVQGDSFDLFTCIDTTWRVDWRADRMSTSSGNWDDIISYIRTSPYFTNPPGTYFATQTRLAGHGSYADMIQDSILHYFGADSLIINDGADTIIAKQAIYLDYDTTGYYGVFTRPCECACTYNYEYCEGEPGNQDCHCDGDSRIAYLELFQKTFDFANIYPDSVLDALNNEQPDWIVITFKDDYIPFLTINGNLFYLDTIPDSFYYWKIYRINPPDLNYREPMKISTGLGSYHAHYIGGQVIFGFEFESDSTDIVWHYSDSLIIPECCPDTICFTVYAQIASSDGAQQHGTLTRLDTCLSVCDYDTLNYREWINAHIDTGRIADSKQTYFIVDSTGADTSYIYAIPDTTILGGVNNWVVKNTNNFNIVHIKVDDSVVGIGKAPVKTEGALQVSGGVNADSVKVGSGSFIKKWYVASDTLFFIIGSDTFYTADKK